MTVKGTRGFHKIVPNSNNQIHAYIISESKNYTLFRISKIGQQDESRMLVSNQDTAYHISHYIACTYDSNIWLGIIKDSSEEFNDCLISFLRYSGQTNKYHFSENEDICWIGQSEMSQPMSTPDIQPGVKIVYSFIKMRSN